MTTRLDRMHMLHTRSVLAHTRTHLHACLRILVNLGVGPRHAQHDASCRTPCHLHASALLHASFMCMSFPTQGAYQAVVEGRMVERESLPQNTALALENFLGANVLAVSAKYTTHAFKYPRTNGTCLCTANRGLL